MLDLNEVFANFPVLETERFILRAAVSDDAPEIFGLWSNPQVVRYLARQPMTSLEEGVQRVEAYQTQFAEQLSIQWMITPREHGRVIGNCLFWNFEKAHDRAEIGYMLSPDYWGKGIMVEVASRVLNFGFTTMGLHSVEARTDPANAASQGLLKKLGFVQEGYFRENYYDPVEEKYVDTSIFSLLKHTWMNRVGR
jgi:ribosomal-protein-alanine N-acetyltransferase